MARRAVQEACVRTLPRKRREPEPQLVRSNLLQWVLRRQESGGPAGSSAGQCSRAVARTHLPQLPPVSPCQKSLLHRLVLVARGSPELADKRELAGYWERLFQSLQRYYHGEAITGLLLLYPSCMVHVLEASSDVLFSVLRDLRDAGQQGHRPLVMEPKIVVLSHNIPTRLFHQWSYQALNVPTGLAAAGTEPLEGLVGKCLATLLRLGQLQQQPESPPHGLDVLVEQVPELLGLEAAVGHLLACAELQSPEQFLQAYDSPLHPGLGADHVWPVWEHLALPSAALQQTWPMGTPELPGGRKDSRALQHGGFAAGPGIGS